MPGNSRLNPYGSERSIFGRSGKLYLDGLWVATATEITATLTVDKMDIKRAGDYFLRHKPGEISGEGSLTVEYVNSAFTKKFTDYINSDNQTLPSYTAQINLEDPGMPRPEKILLREVTFWELPMGYSLDDLVTRELAFTFYGVEPADGESLVIDNIPGVFGG